MAAVLIIIIWPGMSYCDTHTGGSTLLVSVKEGLGHKILCPPLLNFRTMPWKQQEQVDLRGSSSKQREQQGA